MRGHIFSFSFAEFAFSLAFALGFSSFASFAAFVIDGVEGILVGGICLSYGCKALCVFTPMGIVVLCTLRGPCLIWILPF